LISVTWSAKFTLLLQYQAWTTRLLLWSSPCIRPRSGAHDGWRLAQWGLCTGQWFALPVFICTLGPLRLLRLLRSYRLQGRHHAP